MIEEEPEDYRAIPHNLEAVTLYAYPEKYLIQPNVAITNIKTNITIDRKTREIKELGKADPISGHFEKKASFGLFLGILPILNRYFLVFVELCQKVCSIENYDLFEVREISIIPLDAGESLENEDTEKTTNIFNYILYLKNYLLKEGYYFSYDYDLTLSRTAYAQGYQTKLKFAWNLHMGAQLLKLQQKKWFVCLIQGSIRSFKVFLKGKQILYYLVTRRSWKRGGTRYNARGIDSKGYVANFCQTQQIIFIGNYCFSHIQVRGSVPAFWKQSGIYAQVQFFKTHEETKRSFLAHFAKLQKTFGKIFCINLLSKEKNGESQLTLYYEQLIKQANLSYLRYEYYNFHFACKGQKFQRSNYLIGKVSPVNKYFKYYLEKVDEKKVLSLQNGVMRVNCIDCLDRTNLIQSKVAYDTLNTILLKFDFNIQEYFQAQSILKAADNPNTTNLFIIKLKNAWADNGDTISKHYTGIGSTHTNITRTGKRDLKGMMDHGFKTLGRFYKQYMEDNFKQEVIDILIGEHTETINLAEFEARMKDKDVGEEAFVEM